MPGRGNESATFDAAKRRYTADVLASAPRSSEQSRRGPSSGVGGEDGVPGVSPKYPPVKEWLACMTFDWRHGSSFSSSTTRARSVGALARSFREAIAPAMSSARNACATYTGSGSRSAEITSSNTEPAPP